MKPLLSALHNRFQLRLLLFLLLVGSIPPLLAALLLNNQLGPIYEEERAALLEQSHKRVLDRVQLELSSISQEIQQASEDYAVQRYALRPGLALEPVEERRIRDYLDVMIKQQLEQSRYMAQLCLSFRGTNQTICSRPSNELGVVYTSYMEAPATRGKYVPVQVADTASGLTGKSQSHYVANTIPITERGTRLELGTVGVLVSLDRVVADAQEHELRGPLTIYDDEKRVLYESSGSGNVKVNGEMGEQLESTATIAWPNGEWVSSEAAVEASNPYLTRMHSVLVVLLIGLALVSAVSAYVFARHVTKPLNHLRGLMKRAELGDLKAYWIDDGIDELNALGQSYNQMLNRVEELIKQVKQEEALKKDAEMEALQYQLNPHFLYNTLNTIKWVAKIHKTPQISEVVSALVRLLQASLGKKGDFITIREETGLIRDYMEIQSFRYGERVRIKLEIDPLAEGCLVPRMLLQPLVENAILHGIEPGRREGVITIRAYLDRDLLLCEVEDDGIGIASKAAGEYEAADLGQAVRRGPLSKEKLSGVGITHIREKIKLYYGPDYKMFIINKPGEGTTVRIFLPIHQSEET
ncbi:sensor histidine kinase [Paenibacillus koleovorans]|uniref:sensor histidine kinase n=1 Tax=Paenibacillus koleovorans TaxID=121608 RepID=UPI000FD6C06F|nr:sensor histidine kinase [Paenibacillus koleovorans]